MELTLKKIKYIFSTKTRAVVDSEIKLETVDGFINRGSIFYINKDEVRKSTIGFGFRY